MIDPLIGKQLGPNEITGFLGHGGMADVYRATQRTLKREVAIKVLVSSYARDKAFVERFTREVEVVARLEHPHIVPVYEHGITDEGVVYLAMRYLKGGTLADLIKQRGALPIPQVAQIMLQVGAALDYAHKQGVVHRDVKPSNVMLDENGDAYLTDFGLARPTDRTFAETLTEPGSMLGTPAYVSPEQIQENRSDARSDVYSLGIVLYEMLTGRPPFTGDSIYAIIQAHITKQPPKPSLLRVDLPVAIEATVLRAIQKSPEHRYQSVGEMVNDLRLATQGEIPTKPIPRDQKTILLRQSATLRGRLPLLGAGLITSIVIALGLLLVLANGNASQLVTDNVTGTFQNPTEVAHNQQTPGTDQLPQFAAESERPEVGRIDELVVEPSSIQTAQNVVRGSFIGVVACTLQTDFHASLMLGVRNRASELGLPIKLESAETNEFRQPAIISSFLAQGAKAIILCPLNESALDESVRIAAEQNVPVVAIGERTYGKLSASLSLTNERMGTAVGEYAAEIVQRELDGVAKVAILDYPDLPQVVTRADAMETVLKSLVPKVEVVGRWLGGLPENGEASMKDILEKHPDINVIMSINDAGALGAVRALRAAGKRGDEVIIISVDAESEARRLMRSGEYFRASLDNDPVGSGRFAVDVLVNLLSGKAVPRKILMNGVMITPDVLNLTPTPSE
ncbi:MAG: hypothetical protein OHK0023_10040 [Anaerolineae bacterium]